MDTKWRKFSRSGGFKAILLLIVLGCAAAVGAITGYIPESNYFRDGLYGDVLSHHLPPWAVLLPNGIA